MTADPPDLSAPKTAWRAWARARRADLNIPARSSEVVAGLASWTPMRNARATLIFLPLPDEIDLRVLMEGHSSTFYATHTPDRGGRLTIHRLGGPLEVHRLGFLQPHASSPTIEPELLDVLLLPGLAFDLYGTRLGRGAGYFDRLLSRVSPDAVIAGVTVPELVVDRLPREPHDVPVGYLATDEGVVAVSG